MVHDLARARRAGATDRPPTPASLGAGRQGSLLGATAVFVAATLLYRLMWSPMPVDDAARYVAELQAGRDFWDMAHLWIQPIALRVYRALAAGTDPAVTLAWLNTLSVGLALAVFFHTVRCATRSAAVALLAVALAAASFNFVSLGPTAHIKAMVLPFFALGLHFGWAWENDLLGGARHVGAQHRRLALAGGFLGAGACFLVTTVPMAAFAWLAMLLQSRLTGASWSGAVRKTVVFPLAAAVAGAIGLLLAYWTARLEGAVSGSVVAFLTSGLGAKYEINQFHSSLASRLARSAYSALYNFIYLPNVGQYGRAYIDGLLPSLRPYAAAVARDLALAAFVAATLAFAVVEAARLGLMRRRPVLVTLGFAGGGLVYAFLLNLNDPEHWFQLTLPLLLCLAVALDGKRHAAAALAVLLAILAVPNLLLYVWPRVTYPMAQGQSELLSRLGPHGIHMNYAGYPGDMTTSLLGGLPAPRNVRPDLIFDEQRQDVARTLDAIDRALAPALQAGDPVLAFRIFDEDDWRGPVASLAARGFTPEVLRKHLRAKYEVAPVGRIAGFEAYLISPKPPARPAS